MPTKLYFDTETTGFRDPWLMEYAGALIGPEDQEVWLADFLVALPPGVVPEAQALVVHGITAEMSAGGEKPSVACRIFAEQAAKADMLVGYFLEYDLRVLRATFARERLPFPKLPRPIDLKDWATPLCQIPATPKMIAARHLGYKTPSLSEAMSILCGETGTSHRAMPDAKACRRLHRAIKERLDARKDQGQGSKEAAPDSSAGNAVASATADDQPAS